MINPNHLGELMTRMHEEPIQSRPQQTIGLMAAEISRSIYRSPDDIDALIGCLAIGGHVFMDARYGTGKTMTAKALGGVIGGSWDRIDGNSDLTPSDVTGSMFLDPATKELKFHPGPVFSNVTLFDELPRSPKKAQEGLLQAMAEGKVTPAGSRETFSLPKPNFLIATGNPEDGRPVDKSILDRFAVGLQIPKNRAEGRAKVKPIIEQNYTPQARVTPQDIINLQKTVKEEISMPIDLWDQANVFLDHLADTETVVDDESLLDGQRAIINLENLAKYRSLRSKGYGLVELGDVIWAAHYALSHRISLTDKAESQGLKGRDVVMEAANEFWKI